MLVTISEFACIEHITYRAARELIASGLPYEPSRPLMVRLEEAFAWLEQKRENERNKEASIVNPV